MFATIVVLLWAEVVQCQYVAPIHLPPNVTKQVSKRVSNDHVVSNEVVVPVHPVEPYHHHIPAEKSTTKQPSFVFSNLTTVSPFGKFSSMEFKYTFSGRKAVKNSREIFAYTF